MRASDWPYIGDESTTRVPAADFFGVRDEALRAHATQVDPAGSFFVVPNETLAEIWPTEDYELVRSLVDAGSAEGGAIEDDLFAGIRERVGAR